MQFESLKVFCDVVRFRSFSQAAAANRMSQSAASQIVAQLEKHLDTQLINRSTRPLQVTSVGQAYYERCKELVQLYIELEASFRRDKTDLAATVQVAAIYSVGLGDMGQLVERYMAQQPGTAVQVEYLHPNRVYEKVLDGTADVGLVSFPSRSRELTVLPWRDEEMVLACAPSHPLARGRTVQIAQLEGERYIGFVKELTIRRQVDRFLREHGVTVDVACELDNIGSIKEAIEDSTGVALLPEPTLRREVQAGTLVALSLEGAKMVRPLAILHRRHHNLGSAALGFIDLLLDPHGARNGHPISSATGSGNGTASNGPPRSAHRSRNGTTRSNKNVTKHD
jgi:DNA-binding transcriptional LysR family regulator